MPTAKNHALKVKSLPKNKGES